MDLKSILENSGYTLIELLGKGGTSECYLVKSHKYCSNFVAKVTDLQTISDKKLQKIAKIQYKNEVKALENISSASIILMYDHFTYRDRFLFIIIEYCSMGSIEDKLVGKKPISPTNLTIYTSTMIGSLLTCHRAGLVHHDIKPSNFLINDLGTPKLSDFGISKFYQKGELSSQFMGSLAFVAPEMLQKEPYNPFAADIWALGVTVYYMATGSCPFKGRSIEALKASITKGVYVISEDVHQYQREIIKMCLVTDPLRRATIEELQAVQAPQAISAFKSLPSIKILDSSPRGNQSSDQPRFVEAPKVIKSHVFGQIVLLPKRKPQLHILKPGMTISHHRTSSMK